MKNKHLNIIISSIASILAILLIIRIIDFSLISQMFLKINYMVLIILFFVFLIPLILHSFRIMLIGSIKEGLYKVIMISSLLNLLSNILPFKIGDISSLYYYKKHLNKELHKGTSILVITKLFDLASVFLIMLLSYFIIKNDLSYIVKNIIVATLIAIIFGFVLFIIILKQLMKDRDFHSKIRYVDKFIRYIKETAKEIHTVKHEYNKLFILFIVSIMIWISRFLLTYLFFKFIGINLGVYQILIAASISILVTIIPIQTIASIGTYEATWSLGFILVGLDKHLAISSGLFFHSLYLLFTIISGSASYLILMLINKKRSISISV